MAYHGDTMRLTPPDALDLLFRTAVKAAHPDANPAPVDMDALRLARDTLRQLVAPGPQNNPCGTCSGSGRVRATYGTVQCGTCKGTGDKT